MSAHPRLDPTTRYGLRLTLAALAVLLVALPFSALLFQVLTDGPLTRFDVRVADDLNRAVSEHHSLVVALRAVSWLGKPPALWFAVAVGVVFTERHRLRRLSIYLVATSVTGWFVSTAVKVLVDRPRPEVDHPLMIAFGKSFPSGHAMSSTVVYGALLLAFLPAVRRDRRNVTIAAVGILVLCIGLTRLLLGVHFVSDVLAGWVLGLAWLSLATAVFEIWRVDRGRRPAHVLDEGVEPEAAAVLDR